MRIIIAAFIALVLAGCVTTPQTPQQRLAAVDAQFAALVNAAADLREQGVIDAETAEEIDPAIQRGDQALDSAWAAVGRGNPDNTIQYIRVVNRTLLEIRSVLEETQNDVGNSND